MNAAIPTDRAKQIAWLIKNVQTLLKRPVSTGGGGFDPNADPVVIGNGAAGGTHTVSVGRHASTTGAFFAVAIGDHATASADDCIAIGDYASATVTEAVAIGVAASGAGDSAVAVGNNAYAGGLRSAAFGRGSYAGGDHSVAIGDSASANDDWVIMLGTTSHFVEIPGDGVVFHDSGGGRWRLTVDTSGSPVWAAA